MTDDRPAVTAAEPGPPLAPGLQAAVAAAFTTGGALARVVEGYEPRAGQRAMADAVASVIDEGGTLLAEAGTGTGKTLAYLIPAILSGKRVLVSTGTKNLQEQIYFKDLPALQRAIGVPFTATLMKGRSNYLCLHRWEAFKDNETQPERAVFVPLIDAWARQTGTGDRAEIRELPEDLAMWKEIAAEADTCLGSGCPRHGDCFVTLMRQRAAASDVVIVNHHLLCADAAVRRSDYGEVIPACPTLVVDEAHQLEDVATQYFGVMCSNFRVDDLVRDAERAARAGMARAADALRELTRLSDRSRTFFNGLSGPQEFRLDADGGTVRHVAGRSRTPSRADPPDRRARYTVDAMADHFERGMMLAGALEGLEATFALAQTAGATTADPTSAGSDARGAEALHAIQRRAGELRQDLRFLMRADAADFVFFLEVRGRGVFLRASPIDVSRTIQEALFSRIRTTVLTSATLTVEGSFDYVQGRLGIREADRIRVASEFEFARQALLYLPRRMPPPRDPRFNDAVAQEVIELLRRSRGRAFVLFTSYAVLRAVQRAVELALPYPVMVQGSAPRSALIDAFRTTPNAVLLATSSFWQGVDVAGDALSCVIIDKLPFASPSDPVTAARIEAIQARGGDAFADYQVPLAILALQQGLGRLIRHRSDRGVLAVLDPRLRTMGYGRRFLASLPPAPVTHDIDAVGRFFE